MCMRLYIIDIAVCLTWADDNKKVNDNKKVIKKKEGKNEDR